MTTREQIIAAARESQLAYQSDVMLSLDELEAFYAIAFEAGRLAERVVTIKDDDDLRFIKRVLEGNNPAEKDKERCLQLIHEIRSRARSTHGAEEMSNYYEQLTKEN